MSQRWYEHWLLKASQHERGGRIAKAVEALDKAETKTFDPDELKYLRLWRDRLKKSLAQSEPGS